MLYRKLRSVLVVVLLVSMLAIRFNVLVLSRLFGFAHEENKCIAALI